MSNTNASTLSKAIGDAPIAGDLPRLNAVVETGHAERRVEGPVPILCDLRPRRLHLTDFVRAARQQLGLLSVPIPHQAKSRVRHALRGSLDLGFVPAFAAIGGYLH